MMNRTLIVTGLMLAAGMTMEAQATAAKAPAPTEASAKRPRIAYAASPEPEQPKRTQPQYAPPIYYLNGYGQVAAPFVVLSDGSILANFGNGYERVLRPCAPPQRPVQNADGRDALGRILPPPGIAALQQGARGQVYGKVPDQNVGACYALDGQGRAMVR